MPSLFSTLPDFFLTVIYSSIPGAVLRQDSTSIPLVNFSTTTDVWLVPCAAQVNVVAAFACVPPFPFFPSPVYLSLNSDVDPLVGSGQNFAIHPLDVTDIQILTSSRHAQLHRLRQYVHRYCLDFGTTNGTPLVQMLSTAHATKSAADYIAVHAAAMASIPSE
ncbi:hypothetical protein K438DRAFT_1988323 [Mycena galopus ATCC 62051]|nr:hypothetical protein K438DRAFT_1988323 [Mycena galopus ATCC 62051]